MLIRTLGIVLLVAGVASIIAIAVPSITGSPFGSSMSTGGQLSISKDGIYLTSSMCTSLPYSDAYQTYLAIKLVSRTASPWIIKIGNPGAIKLHVYIAPGCQSPPPPPPRVESFREIDYTIKFSLMSRIRSKTSILVYHNLPWRTSIDVTRLGGRSVTIVVVYYLPASSFDVISYGNTIPGTQALQQALQSSLVYNTPLGRGIGSLEITIRTAMKPRITMLSVARASSIIVAGLLVIAVDAGLHPEYYRGRWSMFRRLAGALGLSKRE